jgi:hypothetical protein
MIRMMANLEEDGQLLGTVTHEVWDIGDVEQYMDRAQEAANGRTFEVHFLLISTPKGT